MLHQRNADEIEGQIKAQEKMGNDRRRHPRHTINKESLFITSLNSGKSATVRNINMTGLAIEHFASGGDPPDWRSIDIFMGGRDPLYLHGIRCRLIYNIGELSENISFSGTAVRVCGLQFEPLTKDQEDKLKRLLINSRATKSILNGIPGKGQEAKQAESK